MSIVQCFHVLFVSLAVLCSTWDLSFLSRGGTSAPLQWKPRVLTTLPGSPNIVVLSAVKLIFKIIEGWLPGQQPRSERRWFHLDYVFVFFFSSNWGLFSVGLRRSPASRLACCQATLCMQVVRRTNIGRRPWGQRDGA